MGGREAAQLQRVSDVPFDSCQKRTRDPRCVLRLRPAIARTFFRDDPSETVGAVQAPWGVAAPTSLGDAVLFNHVRRPERRILELHRL